MCQAKVRVRRCSHEPAATVSLAGWLLESLGRVCLFHSTSARSSSSGERESRATCTCRVWPTLMHASLLVSGLTLSLVASFPRYSVSQPAASVAVPSGSGAAAHCCRRRRRRLHFSRFTRQKGKKLCTGCCWAGKRHRPSNDTRTIHCTQPSFQASHIPQDIHTWPPLPSLHAPASVPAG